MRRRHPFSSAPAGLTALGRCAVAAVVIGVGWPAVAAAGTVDGELAATLERSAAGDVVPVLVDLEPTGRPPLAFGSIPRERRAELIEELQGAADRTEAPIRRMLDAWSATDVVSLWAIGALAASVPVESVPGLAAAPGVRRVRLDGTLTLPEAAAAAPKAVGWNLGMIGAPELWARGITGTGVVVAVLDSGVDPLHADLAPRWRGGAGGWFDPYGQHAEPHDPDGHGTQVAGLVVGGDASGAAIGVAPGAQWIAARAFDDAGSATYSGIHQAFQWLLDPDGVPTTDDAPDVVNASWGFADQAGQCVPEFEPDIALLRASGVAVVFSAGNAGPGPGTSVSPADNLGAFPAGGVDASAVVMSSSSRGPSACNGAIFPAVVAPGDGVLTADKTFGGVFPAATATVSGTSFAAPHVAGSLALLLQAHPEASLPQLESSIRSGALDVGVAGPDNDSGWGLLDVVEAEARLAGLLAGPGTVTTYDDESAFLAALADRDTISEGFEDDAVWGDARFPSTRPGVASQGIVWTSNHTGNGVATAEGPEHGGSWAFFSYPHGDQTVTDPNGFITDGFVGTGSTPMTAVGGWIKGSPGSRVALVLDNDQAHRIDLGPADNLHSFHGAVVTGSFTSFELLETEGTREDSKIIFGDDFTVAVIGGAANQPPDATILQPAGDVTIAPGGTVFFEGVASDPDGDPVTVLWDFGDGRTSGELVPGNVIFQEAGSYIVTLTASDDGGLADPSPPSRTVMVGQPAPPMTGVVAGVANVPGAQGSDWHTDLFLHNVSSAEISAELSFSPEESSAGDPGLVAIIAPDETLAVEDVVSSVFGVQGSGAIQWRVSDGDPDALLVSANTYNRVDAARRYGQQVPGIRWSDAAPAGTAVLVPALANRYRTNLGLATDGDCTEVHVRGYDRAGALVAQRSLAVQPWSWMQLNSLFRRVFPGLIPDPDTVPLADSVHRFEVVGVDGRVVVYTSIIDNTTSDGSYMVGLPDGGAGVLWLPGAAAISGANNSNWHSDLVMLSAGGAAASAHISFYPSGQNNGGPLDTRTVELTAGASVVAGNILAELFGYSPPAVGSLQVAAQGGAPLLWMRTYTEEPAAGGGGTVTYGQAILARTVGGVVPAGGEGRVAGFSHDAITRANLILQNIRTSSDGTRLPSEVRVELLASNGSVLAERTYALMPGEYRQINRFVDGYGSGSVRQASLRLTVLDQPGSGETGGVDAGVSEVNGNAADGTNDSRLIRAETVASR